MEATENDKRKCPSHLSTTECTKQLLPVKDALDILSGKWKLQIILSLTFGKKRFKQIQRDHRPPRSRPRAQRWES